MHSPSPLVARRALAQAVLLCALVLCAACAPRSASPRAVAGLLDARGHSFEHDGILPLAGEWELYFGEDLTPADFAAGRQGAPLYVSLAPWTRLERDGKALPRSGYGTYRLRVQLPPGTRLVALEHWVTMTASAFYLDGQLAVAHGRVGKTPEASEPLIRPAIVDLAPRGETLEIVVRVSNFSFLAGGLSEARLGLARDLYAARDRRQASTLILLGAIVIMALYHAGLYGLRRKERAPIFFAAMCGSASLFALCSGDMFVFTLFPGLSGELWWKLYMLGWYTGVLFFHPLLAATFPGEYRQGFLRVHYGFVLAMIATVLLFPMRVHLWIGLLFHAYSLLTGATSLVVTARALRRQRPGARLLLAGFLVLFLAVINDILVALRFVPSTTYVITWGLFFFILCQSVLLAARFSRAFDMVEASERSRTQFFHNTSHELRTPLNGILGFVDLLRRGHYGPLEQGAREALERVVRLTEGLRGQVNTILELARSKQGKLEASFTRFSLDEVVNELRALAEGLCLSGGSEALRFRCEVSWQADSTESFVTDREKLLTIVRNLLGNAFKFREPGKAHEVELSVLREPAALRVVVSDTGIGIAAGDRERIFDEFVQLNGSSTRSYEGTGLGLAMVRRCVSLLGGTLSLDSQPGRGTRFTLVLPEAALEDLAVRARDPRGVSVIEDSPSAGSAPVFLDDLAPLGGEVMVVDDNPINVQIMRELLKSAGYAVIPCSGGREALAHLEAQRPDLVLLDLMMPEVSGEQVLTTIRERPELRDLPVILLTARASREDRLLGLRRGADDYLAKPVDSGELLLRVRNTLERRSLAREKAERDQHLDAARAVQEALLPFERSFPGVTVEDHYHAAEQMGGDWFGYGHDARARRLYVGLGDVTGHGMPAALVTGAAAGAFRAALTILEQSERPPHEALRLLSRAMDDAVRQTGARAQRYMTMSLVCLELTDGTGCLISAGHAPVHLFGAATNEVLGAAGAALGMEGPEPVVERFRLPPGGALFMHSDGLTENAGPDGRVLSLRKLQRVLREGGEDLTMLKRLVLAEGQAIWREQAPSDDTCFVLLRWHGPSRSAPPGARAEP